MRVGIIGGGAAGITAAYYLSKKNHEVVLFEKQETLGGNVRTLGKNVSSPDELSGLIVDHGVIEFPADKSPFLSAMLAELGVETSVINGGSTSLFLENGSSYHMPGVIRRTSGLRHRLTLYTQLTRVLSQIIPIGWRARNHNSLTPFGTVLGDNEISKWLKMIIMYAYSMPFCKIDQFPLELALKTIMTGSIGTRWMSIVGGVYSYFDAVIQQTDIKVRTACTGIKVRRDANTVVVSAAGKEVVFDQIMIATPPHEVLSLLADATIEEQDSFRSWQPNLIETIVHTDTSIYDRWNPPEFTEFDLFEKNAGKDAGYNAYLNRLTGQPTTLPPHLFLAFNMEDQINPTKILHRQQHATTSFSADNDPARIHKINGQNLTYFAGAYLYDGLHEGAIQSGRIAAEALSSRLPPS